MGVVKTFDNQFQVGRGLLEELKDGEIGRLARATVQDRRPILEAWEDLAGTERMIRDTHQGRYLFELIQNANDAIVDAGADTGQLARADHRVRVVLSEQSLLVANFGKPFGEENVRALRRLHKTTKQIGALADDGSALSRSKRIGHKGIGFKSVLEITSRPEVYSGYYAFGFDANEFYADVANVIDDAASWTLPTFRVPYPRNLRSLPAGERERIHALFDAGYVTVIRLPVDDPALVPPIEKRIERDIRPELLLFMPAISRIEVEYPDGCAITYRRRVGNLGETDFQLVVLTYEDESGSHEDSRWLTLRATRRVEERSLLQGLPKAWQDVEALGFALAFPLSRRQESASNASNTQRRRGREGEGRDWSGSDGQAAEEEKIGCDTSEPFHVYYPTHECSGLGFKIHGDFYVGDDRQSIPLKPLNRWLMNEICDYLTGEGLAQLKQQWPHSAELVTRLLPVARPEGSFARSFMENYLSVLRHTPFVPTPGQHYRAPEDVRLPPAGMDPVQFRQLFPPSRLRGDDDWVYPTPAVIEQELVREARRIKNPDELSGLLRQELGTKFVTPVQVIAALENDGLPPVGEADELVAFLADWHNRLPGGKRGQPGEREEFEALLRELPIFPTVTGWQQPSEDLVFQANIRAESDEDTVPDGFHFSIIRRTVYPAERGATDSNQYKLFAALGAEEYGRRSLIVRAILPVLTNESRFEKLQAENPDAVYEAYTVLQRYFKEGGTTRDFEERLSRVPVPAIKQDGHREWRPANECYFGPDWPGQNGLLLQQIYGAFEDCSFLDDIPELIPADDEEARRDWGRFFQWLGVAHRPRVLVYEGKLKRRAPSPFADDFLWAEYMANLDERFRCTHPTRNHGYTRELPAAYTIHHFKDLVQEAGADKLLGLYSLLGVHWDSHYEPMARQKLGCPYVSTGCPRETVDSYLLYQLKHARWLPARMKDEWTQPLSPRQIWRLGETEPADVRALVPTLPPELHVSRYSDFANDLQFAAPGGADIDGYVRLLRLLPERYPLTLPDSTEKEEKEWQDSVRAVFNWICERIQTGLVARGKELPPVPDRLQVLAYKAGVPCYVPLGTPDLVYPDNSFLAERWENQCAYLRINDDWRTLLGWLGIPDLSMVVESKWEPEGYLTDETTVLQDRFDEMLPYYLALLQHTQPANYPRLLPRLSRLRIQVVKRLAVVEHLKHLPDAEPITSTQQVHLDKREEDNPGVGRRTVIAGDLYITRAAMDNPDLLGDYIADYIEISRLGDAFVILFNRDSDDLKWRFLESKGISRDILKQAALDLQARVDSTLDGNSETRDALDAAIKKAIQASSTPTTIPTPATGDETGEKGSDEGSAPDDSSTNGDQAPPDKPARREYPKLNLEAATGVKFAAPGDGPDPESEPGGKRPGGGGRGGGRVPAQEITEELGRRGEKWAYTCERQRLRECGWDPDELEEKGLLVWVADEQPTANHDILSIRGTGTDKRRPICIEVKASAGDGRHIRMSRSEFNLAMSRGEDYWIYWVANVDEEVPDTPVCYQNVRRLINENRMTIDVDTLAMTLPEIAGSTAAVS